MNFSNRCGARASVGQPPANAEAAGTRDNRRLIPLVQNCSTSSAGSV